MVNFIVCHLKVYIMKKQFISGLESTYKKCLREE